MVRPAPGARAGPARAKLQFDPSLALGDFEHLRRCIVSVPAGLRSVSDLASHLSARFAVAPPLARDLAFKVDGFCLPPTEPLASVLRDADVLLVGTSGHFGDGSPPAAGRAAVPALAIADRSPQGAAMARAALKDGRAAPRAQRADHQSSKGAGAAGGASSAASAGPVKRQLGPETDDSSSESSAPRQPPAAKVPRLTEPQKQGAKEQEVSDVAASELRNAKARVLGAAEAAAATEGAAVPPPAAEAAAPAGRATPQQPRRAKGDAADPTLGTVVSRDKAGRPQEIDHPQLGSLEIPEGEDPVAFTRRKLERLRGAIRRQFDHYFGATNWPRDQHLQSLADAQGWAPLAEVAEFDRLRTLSTDAAFLAQCLGSSEVVEVSVCRALVRRRPGATK